MKQMSQKSVLCIAVYKKCNTMPENKYKNDIHCKKKSLA